MNKELKTLLITLGVALGLVWVFRPKKETGSKSLDDKYSAPKEATPVANFEPAGNDFEI